MDPTNPQGSCKNHNNKSLVFPAVSWHKESRHRDYDAQVNDREGPARSPAVSIIHQVHGRSAPPWRRR